ncbi:uncharacterized protein METZ01_LOCUS393468 [marine metagenome]|uniref:Uncharacterized protein n=1 Tax=marine metagenome TaxID=408172 RepID=A0A382V2A7_9ZZZZ
MTVVLFNIIEQADMELRQVFIHSENPKKEDVS